MNLSIDQQKQAFRVTAKAKRLQAFQDQPQAGVQIAEMISGVLELPAHSNVSVFWPLAEELDTLPILHALHTAGHQVLLPIMQGAGKPLLFGCWAPGDVLVEAAFKTLQPSPEQARMTPDVMLCPLLAFDRNGYRMGYGGGFYDRSIAQIKAQGELCTIGIAFAAQEVDSIVIGEFDEPLDMIVTEQEIIRV
ncbi:MAG TPA: 5-formyltetrahydrofolate cyclo-ligase [Oceanospirillaceae bacterium]|mgnify:CR=1 FL=1|nr:5-formyltetrahydrofolate cyclo-ligase [Oceanospirillaceae bacterium]